jgi:hypothetical protein
MARCLVGVLLAPVDSNTYQNVTITKFSLLLQVDERNFVLQQHDATCYALYDTKTLWQFFGYRLIAKGLWPPRSADLTSTDFLLWSCLKGPVYWTNAHTEEKLQTDIGARNADIIFTTLHTLCKNIVKRLRAFIRENGSQFRHLL